MEFTPQKKIFTILKIQSIKIFLKKKFIFSPLHTQNITNIEEQSDLINAEHQRAHRRYQENFTQLKEKYFFPKMKEKIKAHVQKCKICKKQKFDTHPIKNLMNPTPILHCVDEYIQIDIFHVGNQLYYSAIDRYSKFLILRHTPNKLNADKMIQEILQIFPNCKYCMTDNEAIFTSFPVKTLFKEKKNLTYINTESTFNYQWTSRTNTSNLN